MKKHLVLIVLLICTACSENMLRETAKTDTTEALFYQAKLKMNAKDYSAAISILQTLGATFLSRRDVALVYASAFSGRCGLDFVTLIDNLGSISTAGSIFTFLMQAYPDGTDSQIGDCVLSEAIMEGVGSYTERLPDENMLVGLSSLVKVGVVLSRWADGDGDGAPDAGFDHCDTTDFPDDAVREVGTGIAQAILSVSSVATDITPDTLTEITDLCAIDASLNVFCTTTDKNAFTALEVKALRALIGSNDSGIGSCVGGFLLCLCP